MICPHCEADTPPTQPYCQSCGLAVDITYDKVKQSFADEALSRAQRDAEERARWWLLTAAVALAVALAARWLLVPAVPAVAVLPPVIASQPQEGQGIEPLPLELPGLEVPK